MTDFRPPGPFIVTKSPKITTLDGRKVRIALPVKSPLREAGNNELLSPGEVVSILSNFPREFLARRCQASSRTRENVNFTVTCRHCEIGTQCKFSFIRESPDIRVRVMRACEHFPLREIHRENGETFFSLECSDHERDEDPDRNHPIRLVGKYLHENFSLDIASRQYLAKFLYSATWQRLRQMESDGTTSLEQVIEQLPGLKLLVLEPKTPACFGKAQWGDLSVQAFAWFAPWGASTFRLSQYYCLDGSFQAISPYVYAVPIAVQGNESLPLGLFFAPSERADLFQFFFRRALEEGISPEELKEKPILSDEGGGIRAAVESHGIVWHFKCYAHLLRKLGFGSLIGKVATKMLYTSTLEEYETAVVQGLADVRALQRHELATPSQLRAFCDIFGFEFDGNTIQVGRLNHDQGLWVRGAFGVSSTTGHQERVHATFNDLTRGITLFQRRLHAILSDIQRQYDEFSKKSGIQAKEKFKALKLEARKRGLPILEVCPHPHCGWGGLYTSRYNAPGFPCLHNCLAATPDFRPVIIPDILQQENRIVIEMATEDWPVAPMTAGIQIPSGEMREIDESSFCGFIKQLASELRTLNAKKWPDWTDLCITLTDQWHAFMQEEYAMTEGANGQRPSDVDLRAEFRVRWWASAQ